MIENESQPTLKYHFVPGFVGCRTQYIHQQSKPFSIQEASLTYLLEPVIIEQWPLCLLKSNNQCDTLGRWVDGRNDSMTKRLMFQALFFHNLL